MTRVSNCINSGLMENFFGVIKEEMYRLKTFKSFDELDQDIQKYVKVIIRNESL